MISSRHAYRGVLSVGVATLGLFSIRGCSPPADLQLGEFIPPADQPGAVELIGDDPKVVWAYPVGTGDAWDGLDVCANSEAIYITGYGKPPGATGYGAFYVSKHNLDGTHAWTNKVGTTKWSVSVLPAFMNYNVTRRNGVATVPRKNGHPVYVVGWTDAGLPGLPAIGEVDGFVVKYDENGNVVWRRLIGAANASTYVTHITKGSNTPSNDGYGWIYVCGCTDSKLGLPDQSGGGYDFFFAALKENTGELQVKTVYGSAATDIPLGITTVIGDPVLVGCTNHPAFGSGTPDSGTYDIVASRCSYYGSWYSWQWQELYEQIGSTASHEYAWDACPGVFSPTVIYVVGSCTAALPIVEKDARGDIIYPGVQATQSGIFLLKRGYARYGAKVSGESIWARYIGGTNAVSDGGSPLPAGVAAGGTNVYVTGGITGNLGGDQNEGQSDVFLVRYGNDGVLRSEDLFGTPESDAGRAICVDSGDSNRVYIVGQTANPDLGHVFVMCVEYPG